MGMANDDELDANGLPRHWLDTPPAPEPRPARRRRLRLETGREAAEALLRLGSEDLLRVMLRRAFRPVDDQDRVPITPCPGCRDGGLRLAGTLRSRAGRELVRACDTCGAVLIGDARVDTAAHGGIHRPPA
jgi:hypothetical protein